MPQSNKICNIYEAWHDIALRAERPQSLTEDYPDNRCVRNDVSLLDILGVVLNQSTSHDYANNQMIKYNDLVIKFTHDYLTFEAEETNSTIKYTKSSTTTAQYSTDQTNWLDANNITITLSNIGDKVYFKGKVLNDQNLADYAKFEMTGKIKASGSIMSLYNENPNDEHIYATHTFIYLFNNCTSLTQAPELPATTLANNCYYGMFGGCTSLITAPELPATELALSCYYFMFNECTSLTTTPSILPATTLANYCYSSMFNGCTLLTTAPELPATTLADYCYYSMFYGCSNLSNVTCLAEENINVNNSTTNWLFNVSPTGTFNRSENSIWPLNSASGIPSGWTVNPSYTPELVDLGLPSGTKWMKMNLGATEGSTPEDWYGKYFQWGDTVGYTGQDALNHSTWSTCPFNNGSEDFDSVYFESVKNTVCPNGILSPEYDAVYRKTQGNYQLPTDTDMQELIDNTTQTYIQNYNGVQGLKGQLFTSNINGNTLFIPFAGNVYDSRLNGEGINSRLWSCRHNAGVPSCAYELECYQSSVGLHINLNRDCGCSLRGVMK